MQGGQKKVPQCFTCFRRLFDSHHTDYQQSRIIETIQNLSYLNINLIFVNLNHGKWNFFAPSAVFQLLLVLFSVSPQPTRGRANCAVRHKDFPPLQIVYKSFNTLIACTSKGCTIFGVLSVPNAYTISQQTSGVFFLLLKCNFMLLISL